MIKKLSDNNWRTRISFLFLIAVAFFCLLVVRLIDLQIVNGESFRNLADSNRYFGLEIPAERGTILDRYDDPMVYNVKSYYELSQSERLFSQKNFLSREDALSMMTDESKSVLYDLSRQYLFPKSLAHVIGYVGPAEESDLLTNEKLNFTDNVGKMGLEKRFDENLQGKKGKETYEINAVGKKQRLGNRELPVGGESIKTTIDPYLSEIAFEALGNNQGAVIILDANNGQILSMVDSPSFDVNVFGKIFGDEGKEAERKKMLDEFIKDQRKVFFNRAMGGSYPPGSVFKLVTALAGLETGKINQQTTVEDEGILKVGDYEYANWYFTQYGRTEGSVDIIKALSRSNDTYFYKSAEWTGPDKIAEVARQFGFGAKTGIELGGEASGLVPDPAWKEKTIGERWFLGNTYHYGIGQGDILVSPLQVAKMVQGIANKGRICSPKIVFNENDDVGNCSDLGFSEENLELVMRGMLGACSQGGTGYTLFKHNLIFGNDDYFRDKSVDVWGKIRDGAVACKTGTAEFGGADERGYRRTHGWFVATLGIDLEEIIAKKSDGIKNVTSENLELNQKNSLRTKWIEKIKQHGFAKQIVIVALVESDESQPYKEGSRDAGPVVTDIINWIEGE